MLTRSVRAFCRSCWVPCQSTSNRTSRPAASVVLHRLARAAVAVAEDRRVLEQGALGDHRLEAGAVDEEVVAAVYLARPRRPGGDRDRHRELAVLRQQGSAIVDLPAPDGEDSTSIRPRRAMPPARRRRSSIGSSLDVLHLLAHLLDGRLQVEADAGQLDVAGLGAERVGLAIELLAEEIELPADRPPPSSSAMPPRDARAADPAPRAHPPWWRAAPPPAPAAPA